VRGDDNGVDDVFLYDRRDETTTRISVAANGASGDGLSALPSLSDDGRRVAFVTRATNLIDGDTNDRGDVLVHDRKTGATVRASVDSAGNEADGDSVYATIAANGRAVAFASLASNLVPGDTNRDIDVFLHDLKTGTTKLVSVSRAGIPANGSSYFTPNARLGANGRLVPFQSSATNLVADDVNGTVDAFVHDAQAGVTRRVSVDSAGREGNAASVEPTMSANGRVVAFTSIASNLVADDTNGDADVFVHDLKTGITTRVSVATGGAQGNGASGEPTLSADGRYVSFASSSSNLVPDDTNGAIDVFVHDRKTGITTRASVSSGGSESDAQSYYARLSGNGRFVVLQSSATNLVPADVNGAADVFLHDRND
jgi:Tol biopolymer transport system component